MTHLCIDFETLAQRANTAVLSLGAILFDKERIIQEHYDIPSLKEQCKRRAVDASTICWWQDQGDAAKSVFKQALGSSTDIMTFCKRFQHFVLNFGENPSELRVWSNNAGFDVPIMEHLLDSCGIATPWNFWNIRCYRTVKAMYKMEKAPKPTVKHHALEDARYQTKNLQLFFQEHPELEN